MRHAALAALVFVLSALHARADVVPGPTVLTVSGLDETFVTRLPDRATYVLHNASNHPIDVYLFQLVALEGWGRAPIAIDQVLVGGRPVSRSVHVAAGADLNVEVHFRMPSSVREQAQYRLELSVQQSAGQMVSRPAVLTRGRAGLAAS